MTELFPSAAPDVLYLVDISSYVFRAFHAIQPLSSPSGEPTNAVLGTVNMLDRLIRQCKPAYLLVAMDSRAPTFRKELYPEYKAHRPPAPPELKQQMLRVGEILGALDVSVAVQDGVEADDIIATAVAQARERKLRCVIVSADKDLMPLTGTDVLLWDTMRDRVIGPAEVEQKFGVRVDQVRDLLALMGDSSDNVPGVPSVGQKTAQKLLSEFDSVDGIYQGIDQIKRKKLKETLEEHRSQALLSRDLVTLRSDCKLDLDFEQLRSRHPDIAQLRSIYTSLGFQRQLQLLSELESAEAAGSDGAAADKGLEEVVCVTDSSGLERVFAQAKSSGQLGLAAATHGEGERRALIGMGLAPTSSVAYYLPLVHRYFGAPSQLAASELLKALRTLGDDQVALVGHDVKQLLTLLDDGAELPRFTFDSLLAGYLLDPDANNRLETLAQGELNKELPQAETLIHPKRGKHIPLDEIEVEAAAAVYGSHAAATTALVPILRSKLEQSELLRLHDELELPLTRLLARLERYGVLIDTQQLEKLGQRLEQRLVELTREAHEIAEEPFNVNSPRQLEALLFDKLGLKPIKRTKTSRSTDAATLESLADKHPLPRVILEIRQLAKLKGTYVDALPVLVQAKTGRLHTRWGQATAATGRLASSDPNLQNIPIRTELGREIRAAFVAPPGHQLVSADYSQIELRVLAHLSEDPVLIEAFVQEQDVHTRTAMEIFGVPEDQVTSELRRRAKAVNFGVVYGQGESGLAKSLGIERKEAKSFIDAYFQRYAKVKLFMDETLEKAREQRVVRTLLGRLRRVPDIRSNHHGRRAAAERIAMNTPIQGTAADLLKLSMLKLEQPVTPGCRMILTVHDELVFEVPKAEVEAAKARIAEHMQGVYALRVPLVVDVGSGPSWAEAH